MYPELTCPECANPDFFSTVTRRQFVQRAGIVAAAAALPQMALAAPDQPAASQPTSESLVAKLYGTLSDEQKKQICFDWDHLKDGSPLRLHVSANWHITKPTILSDFYTADQKEMIEQIFLGLYNPDWHDRVRKQLKDDGGGWGKNHNVALFGTPGTGKFEFVFTGRHITVRCDGDSNDHVAFGGPIFYGHAAQGFTEKPDHPGNVYWHQALKANALYQMLDGKQRQQALISEEPAETEIHFRASKDEIPGLSGSELTADQIEHLKKVLEALVEPYRTSDRQEADRCLTAQGGLDACRLSFYRSGDLGDDGVWDVWRLEGPSFVWHFRGSPHVHTWVSVADDPSVKYSTTGG